MRAAFLTHYYAPERGAPQTRLRETIAGLAELGIESTVVTGPPHYPSGRVLDGRRLLWPRRDTIDGISVHRLPMIPRPNGSIVDRVIDQASFAAVAVAAAPIIRRSDVFVVESPPLFLGGSAAILRAITGRPFVFHVADPWPDFPIVAGALRGRIPIRLALELESLAYRRASVITTVTPPLVDRVARKSGAEGKVRLVSNSVDTRRFHPEMDAAKAKAELGWGPEFTLVYSGTVGIAQGLETLIEAVRALPEIGVTVRVVGDGIEASALKARAQELGLSNIAFQPSMPADRVPTVLAAADAILVLLRAGPLYEESLPTKLLEGLAAGRPIVASADGYPATLIEESSAGLTSPAEDATALAEAIRAISVHPGRRAMGVAAADLAGARFTRMASVSALLDAMRAAIGGRGQPN
jgi:colanic acid biosynthesis glycosyl transferase WcaI